MRQLGHSWTLSWQSSIKKGIQQHPTKHPKIIQQVHVPFDYKNNYTCTRFGPNSRGDLFFTYRADYSHWEWTSICTSYIVCVLIWLLNNDELLLGVGLGLNIPWLKADGNWLAILIQRSTKLLLLNWLAILI